MIAQLSTSETARQLTFARLLPALLVVVLSITAGTTANAQGSDLELRIAPLSAIDQQFMANQRAEVERLANRLGRRLTGKPDRDVDTLQEILNRELVAADDELTLQAMGIVFGDLLGTRLSMDWVVYRDRAGRSRALRYRDSETYLFPITMISRRYSVGNDRALKELYDSTVKKTQARLPGARWLN